MNDHQIESRDQEVISKFRSFVFAKERRKKKNKIRCRVFGGALAACITGLLIAYFMPAGEDRPEAVNHYSARIAIDKAENAAFSRPKAPPENSVEPTGRSTPAQKTDMGAGKIPKEIDPPAHDNLNQTNALNQPLKSLPSQTGKSPESQQVKPQGIRIAEIVTCPKVENRQCLSAQTEFSVEPDGRPDVWVWMDVRSKKSKLPYQLRHVYYFNNREHASVVLNIKYSRMRTWSNLTLDNKRYAGEWHVEVVTEKGQKISETGFTMVP